MTPNPPITTPANIRSSLTNAARFWEPLRLLYNLILTATLIFWIAKSWPHFRSALSLAPLGKLAILALMANVCYSAAYPADLVIQKSPNIRRYRWILWTLGTLFAILIESYWINDEIYPDFSCAIALILPISARA